MIKDAETKIKILVLLYQLSGNALARVQRASSTMCTRCFETQSSPGCTCTRRSRFLTHSLLYLIKIYILYRWSYSWRMPINSGICSYWHLPSKSASSVFVPIEVFSDYWCIGHMLKHMNIFFPEANLPNTTFLPLPLSFQTLIHPLCKYHSLL